FFVSEKTRKVIVTLSNCTTGGGLRGRVHVHTIQIRRTQFGRGHRRINTGGSLQSFTAKPQSRLGGPVIGGHGQTTLVILSAKRLLLNVAAGGSVYDARPVRRVLRPLKKTAAHGICHSTLIGRQQRRKTAPNWSFHVSSAVYGVEGRLCIAATGGSWDSS